MTKDKKIVKKKSLPAKRKIRTEDRTRRVRAVPLGEGLPNITKMRAELLDMTDILLGRVDPPINAGHLTLMEVSDAYFARASEMTMLIQEKEADGLIKRGRGGNLGDPLYQFRTGELRTFLEMAKKASELGSRRLTKEQLQFEMEQHGRESKGHTR